MYSSRDPYLHSLWHEKDAAYVEAFGSTLQKSAFHQGHGPLDMKRDDMLSKMLCRIENCWIPMMSLREEWLGSKSREGFFGISYIQF